jgi:hypothetical protein
MKNPDKIFFGLLLGGAFPFLFSLISIAIWFFVSKNETYAPYCLVAGLSAGIVIDLFFLKRWIRQRYELSCWFSIFLFFLYNIGIYGMFMGFPVFNLLMAIVAGYYIGKRMKSHNLPLERQTEIIKKVTLFTIVVMTLICISTAIIALTDKTLALSLKGMLGLHFEVTKMMIIGLILSGGIFLITLQFFITKITIIKTLKTNIQL